MGDKQKLYGIHNDLLFIFNKFGDTEFHTKIMTAGGFELKRVSTAMKGAAGTVNGNLCLDYFVIYRK